MELKSIVIIFALVLISHVLSINSNEFCLNKNKQCQGLYSKKCQQLKCSSIQHHNHHYECSADYCAASKKACQYLLKILKSTQSKQKEKYQTFKQNISVCSSPLKSYELKSDDLCLNTRSCMYMETYLTDENGKKNLVCPCFGKYNYHCSLHYCSVNNIACDSFKRGHFKKESKHIRKCRSFNVFVQRKLILF